MNILQSYNMSTKSFLLEGVTCQYCGKGSILFLDNYS